MNKPLGSLQRVNLATDGERGELLQELDRHRDSKAVEAVKNVVAMDITAVREMYEEYEANEYMRGYLAALKALHNTL